ncbi:MAG: protein kinase [Anaerolineae bacterium]|nr:protein kinase [Anaerolineae bacterium]
MTDELLGQTIGGYEILGVIGHGGMATVYRAHQVSMNRTVALKVLPRLFLNDDTYLQRFNREVKIIAKLEHRNIVPVHDYGQFDEQPYIVMRYMVGGSVDDLLAQGPLSIEQTVSIMLQIAPALDYAHSKNVLHRDIKPSNVLMDDDAGAYLTDFGIARILGDPANISITTQGVVGTPSYMSPEQAQGHEIDGRSDVYSLGVMLFEMATGRRPFESETPYSIAVMQVTQPPPAPRSINPSILPAVEQVIYKAMSKNRDDRYDNAVQFADALQKAAAQGTTNIFMIDTEPGGVHLPNDIPPVTPPPVYYPPPPTSGTLPPVRKKRLRRWPNLLVSVSIGGVIGCGLLTLLVVVVSLLIGNADREAEALAQTLTATAATAIATVDGPTITPLPGNLEGDLEGRPTGLPSVATASGIAPIGVRETPQVEADGDLPDARIIYFAERDGNYDLYRMDLRTREDIRLTSHPSVDMYPQVSPDGRQIVFVSDRDGDYELYLMDTDGNNLRQLTNNFVTDRIPSWSPDGRWIIFSSDTRGDGTHDLYQIRPDGTELTLVYSDGLRNSHPRWSHDDRYIIFTGGRPNEGETWEIMRLDRRTGETIRLTDNNVRDWSPVFAPMGDTIIYLTFGEGDAALMTMNVDGGDRQLFYDGSGYEWGAVYSPDMRYLLFTTDATGDDELFLLDVDSGSVQQITNNSGMYADWISYNGS